jgi:hypothetical protein
MKQRIIITSEELRNRAFEVLSALPLVPVHEIDIREYKKDRSVAQNRTLWLWLSIIGNELGESKEELHEKYKDKFLVNIFERDNQDYAEMVGSLRNVYRHGLKDEAVALRRRIVALTSTTTATVAQMQEYLQNIERDAANLGIRLPCPEEGP